VFLTVLSMFFMIVRLSVVWNPGTLDNCVNALYAVFFLLLTCVGSYSENKALVILCNSMYK